MSDPKRMTDEEWAKATEELWVSGLAGAVAALEEGDRARAAEAALLAERAELVEALAPFAALSLESSDLFPNAASTIALPVPLRDLHRARALLSRIRSTGGGGE